ncbi:MAG: hypothetical protein V3U37_02910 [Nitrospinaceae bacterium]
MLSIFVEASCNRYNRDECVDCHVYEPLSHLPRSEWHLSPEDARIMADNIRQVEVLNALAQQEINLTGGEATQNPHIVDIFKIFRGVSPNVCLHTNLEINSANSKRWGRVADIIGQGGRIDITLYPTAWEQFQKPLLGELLKLQNRLLVNIIFENLPHLQNQLEILKVFFSEAGGKYRHVAELLKKYHGKVSDLVSTNSASDEGTYTAHMGDIEAFAQTETFIFGVNIFPAFHVDEQGRRAMASLPFPKENYLIECPAARGAIDIMTVRQNGEMTPCCDVGNLKCQPRFGNLLADTPEEIIAKFEKSRIIMSAGITKNRENIQNARAGDWVDEGVPPYCS